MKEYPNLDWPLMANNITRQDLDQLIAYLSQSDPILTHSKNVVAFEKEWSQWLGVEYSVLVNSGASANLLTMTSLKLDAEGGEIIIPPLTWVSDIASVLQCGFTPVFVDINPSTLGMDIDQILSKITSRTRAVFLTHVLGYNALTSKLVNELKKRNIPLIEDVCESYGATYHGQKLGTFGVISNFSFYYAHHMSTIEGGMICTNNQKIYETIRMLRSHGMVRESTSVETRQDYYQRYPDLNPDFIFAYPGYNVRPTEINGILGRSQLKRLDNNNKIRSENLKLFLDNLDPDIYRTDFETEGSCNYAFTLVLRHADQVFCDKVMNTMRACRVEFRRGTSGGGNQLRQPYLKKILGDSNLQNLPNVDHIHFFGFYIGNYPTLEKNKIKTLCQILNHIKKHENQ